MTLTDLPEGPSRADVVFEAGSAMLTEAEQAGASPARLAELRSTVSRRVEAAADGELAEAERRDFAEERGAHWRACLPDLAEELVEAGSAARQDRASSEPEPYWRSVLPDLAEEMLRG